MAGKLEGRVALVTGGQRGLGTAILREFAAEGATCLVNYPTEAERAEADALVAELSSRNVRAAAFAADIADTDAAARLVAEAAGAFGRLDVLVNNAGVNPLEGWEEITRETWDRTLSVNLTGVFNCCRAALPRMRDQGYGNIINIASISAFMGRGNADYIATKSAIIGLTRSLARQYGRHGIRANCISPGFHNTTMTRRARQATENADGAATISASSIAAAPGCGSRPRTARSCRGSASSRARCCARRSSRSIQRKVTSAISTS